MCQKAQPPLGTMSSLEFICTCIAIAGIFFIFSGMWLPTEYDNVYAAQVDTEMHCPEIVVHHFIGSDLKTAARAIDACSQRLNLKVY